MRRRNWLAASAGVRSCHFPESSPEILTGGLQVQSHLFRLKRVLSHMNVDRSSIVPGLIFGLAAVLFATQAISQTRLTRDIEAAPQSAQPFERGGALLPLGDAVRLRDLLADPGRHADRHCRSVLGSRPHRPRSAAPRCRLAESADGQLALYRRDRDRCRFRRAGPVQFAARRGPPLPQGIHRLGDRGRFPVDRAPVARGYGALCRILGYPSEELVGRLSSDIADATLLATGRAAVPTAARQVVEEDQRYHRADGSIVWLTVTSSLVVPREQVSPMS